MNLNVFFEHFNELNEENAMYIDFKNGETLLVDNRDKIIADGNLVKIESDFGKYITEPENIVSIKILSRRDIMAAAFFAKILEVEGEL